MIKLKDLNDCVTVIKQFILEQDQAPDLRKDDIYLNGVAQGELPSGRISACYNKYILIVGAIGIGKSLLAKELSKYNKNVYYITVQKLDYLYVIDRKNALQIIKLEDIT